MPLILYGKQEVVDVLQNLQEFLSLGELGRVYSDLWYGPYVQEGGDSAAVSQAWMHKGRWQTNTDVAQDLEERAADVLSNALDELIDGNSLAAVKSYVQHLLDMAKRELQKYPQEPTASRYTRTNSLHDSWDTELRF